MSELVFDGWKPVDIVGRLTIIENFEYTTAMIPIVRNTAIFVFRSQISLSGSSITKRRTPSGFCQSNSQCRYHDIEVATAICDQQSL